MYRLKQNVKLPCSPWKLVHTRFTKLNYFSALLTCYSGPFLQYQFYQLKTSIFEIKSSLIIQAHSVLHCCPTCFLQTVKFIAAAPKQRPSSSDHRWLQCTKASEFSAAYIATVLTLSSFSFSLQTFLCRLTLSCIRRLSIKMRCFPCTPFDRWN